MEKHVPLVNGSESGSGHEPAGSRIQFFGSVAALHVARTQHARTCRVARDHLGSHRRIVVPLHWVDTQVRGDQTVWQRVLNARVRIAVGRVDDGIVDAVKYCQHLPLHAVVDGVLLDPLLPVVTTLGDDAGQT